MKPVFVERPLGCGAEPEIVIDRRWGIAVRRVADALTHLAVPHRDLTDLPELAGFYVIDRGRIVRDTPHLGAYLNHAFVFTRGISHELTLVDGMRKWLLDVNIFARLARKPRQVRMPVVRRRDDQAIDVLVVQYGTEFFRRSRRLVLRFFQLRIYL